MKLADAHELATAMSRDWRLQQGTTRRVEEMGPDDSFCVVVEVRRGGALKSQFLKKYGKKHQYEIEINDAGKLEAVLW